VLHGLDLSSADFSEGYIMLLKTFRCSLCNVRNKGRVKTQKETDGCMSITELTKEAEEMKLHSILCNHYSTIKILY
jgi:hypothetical protein